jgi:glycosyltransferase involved in cell wall biosynthesis
MSPTEITAHGQDAETSAGEVLRLAFVTPTLAAGTERREDVVQLLLYAAARIDDAQAGGRAVEASLLSVGPSIGGWDSLAQLFPEQAARAVSVEIVEDPPVPGLVSGSHKAAYDLFELLKARRYDEVHVLDRGGAGYYAGRARRLGLALLDTALAVHVVGGTVFAHEASDALLDRVDALVDDLLERGCVETADAVVVHDRRAWAWYAGKAAPQPHAQVHDLAWGDVAGADPGSNGPASAIVFWGRLGADAGLPLFCDAVERALPGLPAVEQVVFVGEAGDVGGVEGITYVRLRSSEWGVPVRIRHDLAVADELELVSTLPAVVVCDTRRREGLRARLSVAAGLRLVRVGAEPASAPPGTFAVRSDRPAELAGALHDAVRCGAPVGSSAAALELWRRGRAVPDLGSVPRPAPLAPPSVEPLVSVCLTHYARPEKLRTALRSLREQTYENFEVIVVDDGSPEEVAGELERIAAELEPLGWRLLRRENGYLGAARNAAARAARGEWLLFMDDDNAARPHELATLVAAAQRTGAQIVTCFYDAFEHDADLESEAPPSLRFTPFGPDAALGVFTNCFGDANALVSRSAFETLGGYTEDYGVTHEDWELFCRAALERIPMVCVPEPLFWYRVDPGGMFRNPRKQLHEAANRRRHVRPYLELLPYDQARLVQLAQGLTTYLPAAQAARSGGAASFGSRDPRSTLPFARVAVIMRTKDRPLLLRRAIESVLAQTFGDWLLVVVNDGGSPASVELALAPHERALRGRLLVLNHPVPLGMQTAANAAIAACDSEFVVVHDDDDGWDPSFLARTVAHLDERGWNGRLAGVVTWSQVIVEEIAEDGEIAVRDRWTFNPDLRALSLVDLAVENRFPPISFLFRRAALEAVGPFRERYSVLGDWDFHLRVLARFEVDVIPEPLANYHHRAQGTTGDYGNSVHAQTWLHEAKRVELLNDAVREALAEGRVSPGELLLHGELEKRLVREQRREFQRLHDYLWTVEQRVERVAAAVGAAGPGRNLLRNGDFRAWPGPGPERRPAGGSWAVRSLAPGFELCYDGTRVSYRVEQRAWTGDTDGLPLGKTYLHLEHDGDASGASWFVLECALPSALAVAGKVVCVSATCRLVGERDWILVGGRHELGGGRQLAWPDRKVYVPGDFRRVVVSLAPPAVASSEVAHGEHARLFLKLPHDSAFELDLTDVQLELGAIATEFEYRAPVEAPRRRASSVLRARKPKGARWNGRR